MPLLRRRPLLRRAAVAGGSYYLGKRKAEREAGAYGAEPMAQQAAAPPQEPAPSGASNLDQLEQLGKLHAEGVLTDEEFAQQKAKILGR